MAKSRTTKRGIFTAENGTLRASSGKNLIARAIVAWMMKNGEYPRNRKEIQRALSLKERTLNWHLEKLVTSGVLKCPFRGFYQLSMGIPDITQDPDGKLGMHGIVVKVPNLPEGPQGSPPGRVHGWKPGNPQGTMLKAYEEFEGRTVRFHYQVRTHTLMVYMEASRKPLGLEEFKEWRYWLRTMLYPVDPDVRGFLVQVGVNKDYWNWRLDGLQEVRLKQWSNAYEALYQHAKKTIRHEVHLTLKEVTLLEAFKVIDGNSPIRQLLEATAKVAEHESAKPIPPKSPEPGAGGYQSGYA